MAWLLAHILPFIGPVGVALKGWVPSLALLKSTAIGLVIAAVLGAGGYVGWTVHGWGEAPRTEKAKKEAVARASLEAQAETLRGSIEKQSSTLEAREKSLAESQARNSELNQTLEALRAQSAEADDDSAPVLNFDSPWLRDRPAAGSSRVGRREGSGAGGMSPVRGKRPGGS